jgi:streptogramin lyase
MPLLYSVTAPAVAITEAGGNRIGKITTSGVVTEYSSGITLSAVPQGITTGADGNLWFTEQVGNRIGRITTAGVVTEFGKGISAGAAPEYIAAGFLHVRLLTPLRPSKQALGKRGARGAS